MAVRQQLVRNGGHLWDGRPGFGLMGVEADSSDELVRFAMAAGRKHWQIWLLGKDEHDRPGGVLYKPSGQFEPWQDDPETPHPGNVMPQH
jgi:hypothetical protein